MDFVRDKLATGQKLRVPMVVDTFSRYGPGLDVRFRDRTAGRGPRQRAAGDARAGVGAELRDVGHDAQAVAARSRG